MASLEDKPWFAEAATDTRAGTVGGGFHAGGDTSWTTVYILCIRRTRVCTTERKEITTVISSVVVNHDDNIIIIIMMMLKRRRRRKKEGMKERYLPVSKLYSEQAYKGTFPI